MKKSLFRLTVAAVVLSAALAAQSSAELRWSISVGEPRGPLPPPPPIVPPPPGPPEPPPPPPPGGPMLGPVINIGPDFMPPNWLHRWHRHHHHRHRGHPMPPPPVQNRGW
ncbi:MAG: hypothetical protein IJB33_03165 [Akkermansia sp.]|nr:hypothetical protein [Akkermansia sp.]